MGIQQLDYRDRAYFDECINDQACLMIPVLIKRCKSIIRASTYPDDPPTISYEFIPIIADVREVSLQETAHSNGSLIVGDNVIWCQTQLRGPTETDALSFDPDSIADTIVLHNTEWQIIGQPLVGRLRENVIGCQAYLRRRRGGMINVTEAGYNGRV